MAKLTTSDLTSLSNETSATNTINANNAATEAAMENTLSRDGTSPNQMEADLDMNGNDILNVGAITFSAGGGGSSSLGIVGPDPSVDNTIARWDGITGARLDDSGWTISDSDVMTAAGSLAMGGQAITNVVSVTFTGSGGVLDMNWSSQREHAEVANSVSSSSGAVTIDLDTGNYFYTTFTENITSVTFTINCPTGKFTSWSWELTQDAGGNAWSVTAWPASVKWAGGTAPTLSTGANDVDVLTFWTRDGGTTIYGSTVGLDFS